MLAGCFPAARRVELAEIPEPAFPDASLPPEQILFQPEVTCLCGSDLPFFDGDFEGHAIEYPQPVGMSLHEMVGTVIQSTSVRWRAGERVLAVPLGQRGLFERYALPADRVVRLIPGLSDEFAMLAQPFGTVVHALKKLPNMIDRDVVVLGQGPIGQMFNAGLRNMGARRIIGIDPLPLRLRHSQALGATHTIAAAGRDAVDHVRSLLDGDLPEIVIEAVGHRAHAVNDAIALVRAEGRILIFGVLPHQVDGLSLRAALWKNAQITTSLHPDFERTFPLAMQWIAEKRVDLAPLITHRFPLSQIQQAFNVFRDRIDGALKVLVDFPALVARNR
ncbi:MAG: zinc-binding dehydrogenase [Planctomycetota bacterium]